MTDFDQVQSIQTAASETDLKGVLQLKIAGATEPLAVTAPSLSAAEDMADLIDGYCRLVNSGKESCWNRKGESHVTRWHHCSQVGFTTRVLFISQGVMSLQILKNVMKID